MKKIKCTRCDGEGTVEKNNYDYPCFRCMGKGYLLQEHGILKKDMSS